MDMNEWRKNRYRVFNEKIDAMKDHPLYEKLRQKADQMMRDNEGAGWSMIAAEDFIKKVEENPIENIRAWLNGERPLYNKDHPKYTEGKP